MVLIALCIKDMSWPNQVKLSELKEEEDLWGSDEEEMVSQNNDYDSDGQSESEGNRHQGLDPAGLQIDDEGERIRSMLQQERHRTDVAISEVAKQMTSTVMQGNRDLDQSIRTLLERVTEVQQQQAHIESRMGTMEIEAQRSILSKYPASPTNREQSSPTKAETDRRILHQVHL